MMKLSKVLSEGLKDSGWDVFYVDGGYEFSRNGVHLYWSKAVMKDMVYMGGRITLSILLTFIQLATINVDGLDEE